MSTVFLGLDHQWGDGLPQIFETMVGRHNPEEYEGIECEGHMERFSTWDEAVAGHKRIVEDIKKGALKMYFKLMEARDDLDGKEFFNPNRKGINDEKIRKKMDDLVKSYGFKKEELKDIDTEPKSTVGVLHDPVEPISMEERRKPK